LSKIFIQEESADYQTGLEANGERYLSFVEELAKAKGIRIERELRHGAVSTEILTVADEKKADLIVLGGWERDRPARDIIGRTHVDLMLNAKCSVLVIKEPQIDLMYRQA
jgi:nucleotide-binding universal stress UspA family protein